MIAHLTRTWLKRNLPLIVAALILLPLMAIAAFYGYAAIGALPDVKFTGQQMDALSWLPVITGYAAAAVILAVWFNNAFCWEPGRSTEAGWHDLALAGNAHAKWLLVRNDIRWAALLIMSGAFFWMAR